MQLRDLALGIVVIIGCSLIGYGLFVGDEAIWEIDVVPVDEDEIRDDVPVTEYDDLGPQMQDAFRKGIDSDRFVSVPESPEHWSTNVHYRDSYYRMDTVHGDGAQTTMFFSIVGGIGLIILGSLGWYVARRHGVTGLQRERGTLTV